MRGYETMKRIQILAVTACVLVSTSMVIFLTELTSNTATATLVMPVYASAATGLGIHPYVMMAPAAIAASMAFMLPVATPPNAIVFGSGMVTIPKMMRVGLVMNIISIIVATLAAMLLVPRFLIASRSTDCTASTSLPQRSLDSLPMRVAG